jgi:hypothetical protein
LNHTIDLSFHQATLIRQVSLFIDFFQDESYTPKTLSIRGGTTYRDIQVSFLFLKKTIIMYSHSIVTEAITRKS